MMTHLPDYLFYIVPIVSAIAFLASLTVFFQPAGQQYLKYFSIFLFVNFLMESVLGYTSSRHVNNVWLNNIDTLLTISFQLYVLREISASRKAKKVLLFIFLLYPVVAILNIFLVQQFRNFHTMTYSLGSLLIVTGCIYYFWELFQQKKSVDLIRQPPFWICSGLLFYYCCTFPMFGLTNFITSLPLVILQNLLTILIVINICLYLSFTIAFLCRLKIKRSMST
jgi:hypothetical protein